MLGPAMVPTSTITGAPILSAKTESRMYQLATPFLATRTLDLGSSMPQISTSMFTATIGSSAVQSNIFMTLIAIPIHPYLCPPLRKVRTHIFTIFKFDKLFGSADNDIWHHVLIKYD